MMFFFSSKLRLCPGLRLILAAVWVIVLATCITSVAETPSLLDRSQLKLQPFFERNDGQASSDALYLVNQPEYSAILERTGLTLVLHSALAGKPEQQFVRLRFAGASLHTQVLGIDEQPGKSNYFSGSDPAQWQTGIPHFARVAYRQIYPGVDLVFYFRAGQLEYDVQLQPGADANAVRLRIEGAGASLTQQGDAVISSNHTELLRIRKPSAWQPQAATHSIPAKYVLHDHELSIVLGHYDHSQELVVDPALAFSMFLGGNCPFNAFKVEACTSFINDLAVDDTGIYVVGATNALPFPAFPGQPQGTNVGLGRAVVVKLDPTGSNVIFTTFLASSQGHNIAVDSSGAAYIAGIAFTNTGFPPPFPLTSGSFSTQMPASGTPDLPFAAKLSPTGSLVYSTFLMLDSGNPHVQRLLDLVLLGRVAVDSNGAMYVSGTIHPGNPGGNLASTLPFPTTIGSFQPTIPGDGSSFVMKLNPAGSALQYSTYIAPAVTFGGLALDSSGSAYVSGGAVTGYPITQGAFQTTHSIRATDPFVTKLSADGSSLVYSTYVGSGGEALDVAVTSSGEAVITGGTIVPALTPGALCPALGANGFVAKLNTAGTALVYGTPLCNDSQSSNQGLAVAVDSSGGAYVAAFADGDPNGNPSGAFALLNPIQSYFFPFFHSAYGIASLDASGALRWGTFLGTHANSTDLQRIATDSSGGVYLLNSFLTTDGAPQQAPPNTGTYLSKIIPSLGAPVAVLQPRLITFDPQVVGTSSKAVDVVIGNFGDATLAMPTISITGDYSQTNTCTSTIAAANECDINVTFTPTAGGTRNGTVTVHFGGSLSDQTVALTGTGTVPTATPSPQSLNFLPQALNTTSKAQPVSIANNGTAPLQITVVKTTGDFAQTNVCGAPVQIGSTCNISVTFTPTASGIRQGSLILTDNALDSPQTIPLSGFGGQAAVVSLSTNALFFSQNVGSTSTSQPVVVTNIGNAPLNVSHITMAGDFSQSNNCGPVPAGGNCTLQVSFSPTTAGLRTGGITITDDSLTSPEAVSLSGIGSDFSLPPPSGSTATISAGQTANYTLTVSPLAESSTTVSFTCSALPPHSSCSISPPSTTVSGSPQNFTVSIGTTANSALVNLPESDRHWPMLALWVLCLGFCAFLMLKRKQIRWAVAFGMCVSVLWIGCGGGGSGGGGGGGGGNGTPSGTYTVVVTGTATSGGSSLAHSTSLTLIVK